MKAIIKLTFILLLLSTADTVNAQILRRVGQKAKERGERKVDQTIDKGLDKAENKIDSIGKKEKKPSKKNDNDGGANDTQTSDTNTGGNGGSDNTNSNTGNNNTGNTNNNGGGSNSTSNTLQAYSKFDFVPGDKIVLLEDFSKDNLGDFPAKWSTNGSGEVVNINGDDVKYLKVSKEAIFYPIAIKTLPDEFTLEFDLLCNEDFNYYSYEFVAGLTSAKDIKTQWNYFGRFGHGGENNSRVELQLHPNDEGNKDGLTYFVATHKTHESLRNNAKQNQLSVLSGNTKVHISIWRQKQRVRIYLNEKKVWDMPNALEANVPINSIYFRSNGTDNEKDAYYISNIKLATGNPNAQKKLITEGRFSTSNMLFDVNSDRIKPESYGTLKEIAAALNENANVRIKIIGHTDGDGDDATNLDLSKRRAASVKNMLAASFNVDASRMETDGKGEAQPLVPNTTAESKAQNRRVEFIKL